MSTHYTMHIHFHSFCQCSSIQTIASCTAEVPVIMAWCVLRLWMEKTGSSSGGSNLDGSFGMT